ncbi:MAG: TlpA family protein disulfide reductase [Cyclobacteriaceae bacterium]|nr:TlpA family protein disulfide reductase [Cyclobacteriaceae bacterium SS2]
MKILALTLILISATASHAQEINMISLESLNKLIESPDKKLKVINFWASWCRPCIMEMPHFEAIDKTKATVYFITLDHPQDIAKAQRMVEKNGIKSKVLLLDEKDADKYITAINEDWSGAIPATLFVDARGRKYFHEKAFDKPELENYVKKYSSYNK